MSMISGLSEELRDYASRVDGTFPLLASALRDAADLILELRDDLQQANAEKDQLRELVLHTVECVRRLNDTSENGGCVLCPYLSIDYDCDFESRARKLGIEVDG
jgi:hypothetical protein